MCQIHQLYSCLSTAVCRGVLLVGPAGSGKTSCYRVLGKALTSLSSRCQYHTVDGTEPADDFFHEPIILPGSLKSQVCWHLSACSVAKLGAAANVAT